MVNFINMRVPSVLSSPDSQQIGAASDVHPVQFWHPAHPLKEPFHLFTFGEPYRAYVPSPNPAPHVIPFRSVRDGGSLYMLRKS